MQKTSHMKKNPINYSQCWEDPQILKEALSVRANDCILSITSGGDNTLALLLEGPQKIVSIDLNEAQNHLLELKRSAAQNLNYDEYLELLGVIDSSHRATLFEKVRPHLSLASDMWWSKNSSLIKIGIINCGRFERFTIWFAKCILPFIHSKKTILKLLSFDDIEEQRAFYRNKWNSSRWRFFFGLASNRLMLRRFARQRGMFAYAEGQTVADVYRKRFERLLNSVLVKDNFFLHYSLTGKYGEALPPYLEEKCYTRLRGIPASSLSMETNNLFAYLKSTPDDTFSKFNLSDIFEALSPDENDTLWEEIIRTAKNGAIVAYWNNLVQRSYPAHLSAHIQTDEKRMGELQARDMVFFYDSFHVHTIIK